MKISKVYFMLSAVLLLAAACTQHSHIISDRTERETMLRDFQEREQLLTDGNLFRIFQENGSQMSSTEKEAMQFLYAYMPLADIIDHSGDFFLKNVRSSFRARQEMPWGKDIPEREFRHFVLPVRVNNENLDESRMVFYDELKERIKNLSLHDAVLEINHWCHEKVIYTPSDARTSSPLASIRTAHGRCGEESTFTVAALRAMCIPARQVYTPRWAHTDDNHAWVEAWVDGSWYFLGACEPEPVLNLAWFNAPVSRGMLMHTKAFGRYDGPEEKMRSTGVFTEINVTENYAPAARVDLLAVDEEQRPVPGARVEYKVYNYSEYYTVALKETDSLGRSFLSAGKGDMVVWVSKEGRYGFSKISFGKDKNITVVLDKEGDGHFSADLDIIPPAERPNAPAVTPEQRTENNRRFAQEDSIRNAYVATFPTEKEIEKFSGTHSFYKETVLPLIRGSRGNYTEIMKFLGNLKTPEEKREGIDLLQRISGKDLRDTKAEILMDHLSHHPVCRDDIESRYLRNPRIRTELLTAYKSELLQLMSEEEAFASEASRASFREDPVQLASWVQQHIRIDTMGNIGAAPISPAGVWRSRRADINSRDIFFTALARTLEIPARIDEVTGKVQVFLRRGNTAAYRILDIEFGSEEEITAPKGKLKLTFTPTALLDDPKYYTHFTLSKILPDGSLQLQKYEEGEVDMGGGTTWGKVFRKGTEIDTGDYVLVTGTRLASGGVLSHLSSFTIREGQTTEIPLIIRESETEIQVIGSFNSESRFLAAEADGSLKEKSVLEVSGRGYFVVGVLGMGQEPTIHALRDIAAQREAFETWGRTLVLLFTDEKQYESYLKSGFPATLPKTVVCGLDADGRIRQQIAREMKFHDRTTLPMFLIGDTFNRVVFASQGYTIGLGGQIIRVSRKI